MRNLLCVILVFAIGPIAYGASFTPRTPDEGYGASTSVWRFASSLSKDSNGVIELCYSEEGSAERVLGRVDVRPFRSSEGKMPDLRILFAKVEVDGKKKVMLLVAYGLRSGTFTADVPGLTAHSLTVSGTPAASASGEFTLLGFGDGAVTVTADGGMLGLRGRLFFRYVQRD